MGAIPRRRDSNDAPAVSFMPPALPAATSPEPTIEAPTDMKEEQRLKKMKDRQSGAASTVKTSGRGVIEKAVLSGMMASGTNTKIGQ